MVQEACETVVVNYDGISMGTSYPRNPALQDLTTYFGRPVCIASGSLPSTRGRHLIRNYKSGSEILSNFPNGQTRMAGVYGFRASQVFTLNVACTPFHQGVLALSYQYACDDDDVTVYGRGEQACSCTNLPHVRLDMSETTMVQLKVPMISKGEFAMVTNPDYNPFFGSLCLNNISTIPLASGVVAPTYHLYMHLEDIELFGARPYSTSEFTLQGGKRTSKVAKEFQTEGHPFSTGVAAIGSVLGWVGVGIPSLSSITGPTSWFLAAAAGALRSFGYARPQIIDPINRVFKVDNVGEMNVDVATASQVVAATATNTLQAGPTFACTDTDEMAIAFVLSQWNQIQYFNWPTTATNGTLLYVCPISPAYMWFRDYTAATTHCNTIVPSLAPADKNAFMPSGLCYFGSAFKFWRGTIRFRITFAKTKMHGGRVIASYAPDLKRRDISVPTNSDNKVQVTNMGVFGPDPLAHTAIFNLRDGNVFEFDVPYMSHTPYVSYATTTGALSLHVVDAIQAPATVANTVGVIVEVCAGDDFELADPVGLLWPSIPLPTFTFQSAGRLSMAPEELVQNTMGESIKSLKQLISIPKYSSWAVDATEGGTQYKLTLVPWYYQPYPEVTPPVSNHQHESFGYGGNLASCYAFVRGSSDFHVYHKNATPGAIPVMTVSQDPFKSYNGTSNTPSNRSEVNTPRVISSTTGVIHVRTPAFQQCVRFGSHNMSMAGVGFNWSPQTGSTDATAYVQAFSNVCKYTLTIQGPSTGNITLLRSAGEDAAMAGYMGPPPCYLLNTLVPGVPNDPDMAVSEQQRAMAPDLGTSANADDKPFLLGSMPSISPSSDAT